MKPADELRRPAVLPGCATARAVALLVALFIASGPSSAVEAQSLTQSEIVGTVRREGGPGLIGASVLLREQNLGWEEEVASEGDGSFRFVSVPPGQYEIRVEALGYRPSVTTDLRANAREVLMLTVTLRTAAPPVMTVDTLRGDASGVANIDTESLHRISGPLFEGFPSSAYHLGARAALSTSADPFWGGQGMPGSESILFVDGVPYASVRHPLQRGGSLNHFALPTSALSGVEAFTAPVDIEWSGGAGPMFSTSTFDRATKPTAIFGAVSDPGLWSGELEGDSPGGLSFWGGARTSIAIVPDASRILLAVEGMRRRVPRGPTLPASVADQLASGGVVTGEGLNRLREPFLEDLDAVSALARLDWRLGSLTSLGLRLSGGWYGASSTALPRGGFSFGSVLPGSGVEVSALAEASRRLGARVALEGRVGVRFESRDYPGEVVERAGLEGLPSTRLVSSGVTMGLQPGLEGSVAATEFFASPLVHFQDGVNQIKVGLGLRLTVHRYEHLLGSAGSFVFSSPSDLIAGNGMYSRVVGSGGERSFTEPEVGAFIQHVWQPSPGFRMLTGLRADGEFVPTEDVGDVTVAGGWLDLTGISRIPDLGSPLKLGGRLGMSWDVANDGETIVRANLGVRRGRVDPAVIGELLTLDGAVRVARLSGSLNWPNAAIGQESGLPRSLAVLGPDFQPPRTVEAVLEVDRRLAGSLRVGIVGTARQTDFLARRADLNRRPIPVQQTVEGRPVFGTLEKRGSVVQAVPGTNRRFQNHDFVWALNADGWSDYRAVTLTLDRDSGGLQLFSSYTLSKTEDNWFGAAALHPEASLVPELPDSGSGPWEEGVSDFDVRHRATVAISWAPSSFPRIWITPVYQFSSGLPFTPMARQGVDLDGDGSTYNDVAILPDQEGLGELARDWNCLAGGAARVPERNDCRGPSRHSLDVSLEAVLIGLGGGDVAVRIDALNITDSRAGLVDAALVQPTVGGAITTTGAGVSVPLEVNPDFGKITMPFDSGRMLRISISVTRPSL